MIKSFEWKMYNTLKNDNKLTLFCIINIFSTICCESFNLSHIVDKFLEGMQRIKHQMFSAPHAQSMLQIQISPSCPELLVTSILTDI